MFEAIKICWLRLDLPYLALAGLALGAFEFVWIALTVQYVCIQRLLLPQFSVLLMSSNNDSFELESLICYHMIGFNVCCYRFTIIVAVVPLLCRLIVLLACLLLWHLTYVCMHAHLYRKKSNSMAFKIAHISVLNEQKWPIQWKFVNPFSGSSAQLIFHNEYDNRWMEHDSQIKTST